MNEKKIFAEWFSLGTQEVPGGTVETRAMPVLDAGVLVHVEARTAGGRVGLTSEWLPGVVIYGGRLVGKEWADNMVRMRETNAVPPAFAKPPAPAPAPTLAPVPDPVSPAVEPPPASLPTFASLEIPQAEPPVSKTKGVKPKARAVPKAAPKAAKAASGMSDEMKAKLKRLGAKRATP